MQKGHFTRLALLLVVSACSSSSPPGASTVDAGLSAGAGASGLASGGLSSSIGGASGIGGSAATSSTVVGGSSAGGGPAAGGNVPTGGAASIGGSDATGGTSVNAGGGSSARAGAAATGGNLATGGRSGAGGATATGGSGTLGGRSSAGGGVTGGAVPTGGKSAAGGAMATGGKSTAGGSATGGKSGAGGATATGGVQPTGGALASGGSSNASTGGAGPILYGNPYANVNMWLGPVDFAESVYHNACGLEDGSIYPTVIQNLYGDYLIGLDGENIPNVESHCDDCALLTANGKTIVARVITYGIENGVDAIDLSPAARTALGLSNSNWTGTWQFCSCPTNGTPIYYEFDSRQWSDQNFWYMRIWTRNQHLPVTLLETKVGNGAWVAASQESDGAWQTQSGVDFSSGFQVRVTAADSQQLVDTIPAPPGINPANPIAGHGNFQ